MYSILPTLDTTVIWISAPTQSYDRHWWFYGKPTNTFRYQLHECKYLTESNPFSFYVRTFPETMLCTHDRQLFAPAEARFCLFLGSPPFPFYCSAFRTFPDTMPCTRVRQLFAPAEARFYLFLGPACLLFTAVLFPRLFRHSIRLRTSSHFHAIRANDDDGRVRVI